MRRSKLEPLWLAGSLTILIVGLVTLLGLRYAGGDVYERYSSLRRDPLGSGVLYDALASIAGTRAERYYRPLSELRSEAETTVLLLGVNPHRYLDETSSETEIKSLVSRGARVVIALGQTGRMTRLLEDLERRAQELEDDEFESDEQEPDATELDPPKPDGSQSESLGQDERDSEDLYRAQSDSDTPDSDGLERQGAEDATVAQELEPADDETSSDVNLSEFVGSTLSISTVALPRDEDTGRRLPARVERAVGTVLPETILWHSSRVLSIDAAGWQSIYARSSGEPVIAERLFPGGGSIVLATDSFFASNEAMLTDRQSDFLLWVLGGRSRVVFSEVHLGVREPNGVMTLVYRYRLGGFLFGALALAGLYAWRAGSAFIPPRLEAGSGDSSGTTKRSSEALVYLLRRSVDTKLILPAAVRLWRATAERAVDEQTLRQIEEFAANTDPVEGHRRITERLRAGRAAGGNRV